MNALIEEIRSRRAALPASRCLIVGISGIDASGKGYISEQLADRLRSHGLTTHILHGDVWLNLPHVRFSKVNPGEHFYRHGFRFGEMFERFVRPLREQRSINIRFQQTEETAQDFSEAHYFWPDVDVALVEAVFLFRPEFSTEFDFKIWIDCTFETALERAITRAQEGLPPDETIRAFETIYFPAQRFHFERDQPRELADVVWINDPRLG